MSGASDSALIRVASAAGKPLVSIAGKEIQRDDNIRGGEADQPEWVGGIERHGPLEETSRSSEVIRRESFMRPNPALKAEVQRIGVRLSLGATGLGRKDLRAERIRKPCDDFVLQIEEIGEGLVESLRPKVTAALRVDQLNIDPDAIAVPLNATLQDIANIQIAPDLLQIDTPPLVGEGGIAPDHERPADARQIGGQALGHAIDEILLLRVARHVGEGKDDDGETGAACAVGTEAAEDGATPCEQGLIE